MRCAAVAGAGALLAATMLPGVAGAIPTIRGQSWYIDAMHLKAAHKISTGKGVTVAVLDSGVRPIPELAGRLLRGTNPIGENGHEDVVGHGTAMASLIAGAGGGPDRILGVAPDAKILPVQMVPTADMTSFQHSVTTRSVHWAIDHGARVINMSFTAPDPAPIAPWRKELVRYAQAHDAVLVAGTGNKADIPIGEPADIPGVVAVSGLSPGGHAWSGSTIGPATVVSAPAEKVPGAGLHGIHAAQSGTSNSTALVSGELALIMSKFPHISAADAINRLIRTADDRGPSGRDPAYGFGAADPLKALTAKVPHVTANPLLPAEASNSADGVTKSAGPVSTTALVVAGLVLLVGVVAVLAVVLFMVRSHRRRRPTGGPDGPRWANSPGGFDGPGGPSGPGGRGVPPPPGQGPSGYPQPPAGSGWYQQSGPPPGGPPSGRPFVGGPPPSNG